MNAKILRRCFLCFAALFSLSSSLPSWSSVFCQVATPPEVCKYTDPDELTSYLNQVKANFAKGGTYFGKEWNIVQVVDLVQEYNLTPLTANRPIYAVKISKNADTYNPSRRKVVIDASHHANEVMTTEIAKHIIDYLTKTYASGLPEAQQWVDNLEIWVIPMVNPEGALHVFNGNTTWRKNRSYYKQGTGGACVRCNPAIETCLEEARGVDLNRNYVFKFAQCAAFGGSSSSCMGTSSNIFHGLSPVSDQPSEIESQAVARLIEQKKPIFYLSYHTGASVGLVMYPYGCGVPNAEQTTYSEIANAMRDALNSAPTKPSVNGQALSFLSGNIASFFGAADGSSVDDAYGRLGTFSFAIEALPISANGPDGIPNFDQLRGPTVEQQMAAVRVLLSRALSGPMVAGTVKGDTFGLPLPLESIRSNVTLTDVQFGNGERPRTTDFFGNFAWPVPQNQTSKLVRLSQSPYFMSLQQLPLFQTHDVGFSANEISPVQNKLVTVMVSDAYKLTYAGPYPACSGFPDKPSYDAYIAKYSNVRARISSSASSLLRIPVVFHFLRRNDGSMSLQHLSNLSYLDFSRSTLKASGTQDLERRLRNFIGNANDGYAAGVSEPNSTTRSDTGIRLMLKSWNEASQTADFNQYVHFIDNTEYYEKSNLNVGEFGSASVRELTQKYNVPDALNMYFFPKTYYSLGPYGTDTARIVQGVFYPAADTRFGNVYPNGGDYELLSHEFGHYFNLYHSNNAQNGNLQTCLIGLNGLYGSSPPDDMVCDTPDLNVPDPMDLGRAAPKRYYTREQAARMLCTLNEIRVELNPDGDIYPAGHPQAGLPIYTSADNCPLFANPHQIDSNGNGVGDACEPTVTGFWPGSNTGAMVFVFGSNFIPSATKVAVNGINQPVVQILSDTHLVFLPTMNATGPITVTTAAGSATSSSNFGIPLIGLQLTGIWPGQARVSSAVFLFGSGFDPAIQKSKVSINGLASTMVHVVDPTLLVFFVPAGATSGPVTVTVNGQTASTPLTILP